MNTLNIYLFFSNYCFIFCLSVNIFNVLWLRYSTARVIAQISSASQKEKPYDVDKFNQLYLHHLLLSTTLEYIYMLLVRHRFYPTHLKDKKRSWVQFRTTDKKLRSNFGSDFLLCASIDNYRYHTIIHQKQSSAEKKQMC